MDWHSRTSCEFPLGGDAARVYLLHFFRHPDLKFQGAGILAMANRYTLRLHSLAIDSDF